MFYKSLPMTGFELWISGVEGDRSTNWATTTAHISLLVIVIIKINNLNCRLMFYFQIVPHFEQENGV